MNAPLYSYPQVYEETFPSATQENRFFASLLGCEEAWILDLAGGTGAVGDEVAIILGGQSICLDREPALSCLAEYGVGGDLYQLPFPDETFGGALSRLFGVAYALGAAAGHEKQPLRELARVLVPGGRAAIEVPLARRPSRLQGMAEETQTWEQEYDYRFEYGNVRRRTDYGLVLDSTIDVRVAPHQHFRVEAPLHVFRTTRLRNWAAGSGLRLLRIYPSYDQFAAKDVPPADALRGVLLLEKPA